MHLTKILQLTPNLISWEPLITGCKKELLNSENIS